MAEHSWFDCPLCGWSVRCGKCGNNACNGTYGCDECPTAYDLQDSGEGRPEEPKEPA